MVVEEKSVWLGQGFCLEKDGPQTARPLNQWRELGKLSAAVSAAASTANHSKPQQTTSNHMCDSPPQTQPLC